MPLTSTGCSILASGASRGCGGPAVDSLEFAIGNSSEAFSAGQVALQGTSERRPMLAGYPKVTDVALQLAADFPPSAGRPAELLEYAAFSGATMLNRLVVTDTGSMYPQHTARPQMSLDVAIGGGSFTTVGEPIFGAAVAKGLTNVPAVTLYVGLGDSDEPFDPEQTDLQGTNRVRRPMASGYPQVAGAELRFVADFEVGSAPAVMREIALFDALVGGNMIWRQVVDLGAANPLSAYSPMIAMKFEPPA